MAKRSNEGVIVLSALEEDLLTVFLNKGSLYGLEILEILTGLTQLSQAMARLRRAERQTTRGQTWKHPDVLVAELNNLTIIYV